MGIIFECNWEDGSGILNTGGTYAWTTESDVDNRLSEASDSAMWNSDYLYWNGQSNNAGYVAKGFPSTYSSSGYRFGVNLFSEGLSAGQQQCVLRVTDSSYNPLFDCYLYDNGSNILIYFRVYDTGGVGRNTSAIILSTNTNYQVVAALQKNTAGGFYFKVYEEDGTTANGPEVQLNVGYTTRNSDAYALFMGTIFASLTTTEHGFDIVQVIDSYAYPYTVQEDIVLAVAELTHSHSLDALALTQAHTLSVNELLHSHSLDAPALTQAHILSVNELSHSHNLDNVVITVSSLINLTVQDLLHSHAIDAVITTRAGRACLAFTAKSIAYNSVAKSIAYNYMAKSIAYNYMARNH